MFFGRQIAGRAGEITLKNEWKLMKEVVHFSANRSSISFISGYTACVDAEE